MSFDCWDDDSWATGEDTTQIKIESITSFVSHEAFLDSLKKIKFSFIQSFKNQSRNHHLQVLNRNFFVQFESSEKKLADSTIISRSIYYWNYSFFKN